MSPFLPELFLFRNLLLFWTDTEARYVRSNSDGNITIHMRKTRCKNCASSPPRFWLSKWRWLNAEHGFGRERAEMIYIAPNDVSLGNQNTSRVVHTQTPYTCVNNQSTLSLFFVGPSQKRQVRTNSVEFSHRPMGFGLRTLETQPWTMNLLPFISQTW